MSSNYKLSYADVVKLKINTQTQNNMILHNVFKKNIKGKQELNTTHPIKLLLNTNPINNINFSSSIKILLNKLLRYAKKTNINYNNVIKNINNIIVKTTNNSESIIKSIINIDQIITFSDITKLHTLSKNTNHDWVSEKLTEIIKKYHYPNSIKIMDIGGGEGNILQQIGLLHNIPNNNLYCVEQQNDWSENYKYDNNLNYIFWDNEIINVEKKSIDIILIMVALHHMDDQTITNLMNNIKSLLKDDGIIIIKEHDNLNDTTKKIIDWEHHIYHILMTTEINEDNLKTYLNTFVNNYKSMNEIDKIFEINGFKIKEILDRKFTKFILHDHFNPTNLYWKIYEFDK